MASLFQKRLRCFYCGQRSAEKKSATVRDWRCDHCEAVNYLDENGEITDPPASVTNVPVQPANVTKSSVKPSRREQAELFCSKCIRNQHLLLNALGSYLPDVDDPEYPAFEREYPKFRRNMEERYPQVCENCEQKVEDRIRESKYEAKADHLRRIMDRSKISRASKKARNRNWRHIVDMAGFLGFWVSVVGQLVSDVKGALESSDIILHQISSPLLVTFVSHMNQILSRIGYSSQDLASAALIAGLLSIWWNPRVHYKVEGMNGRILGLKQYYECQLIVMVTRFGVWALLKDTDRLQPTLPPTLHAAMIIFMGLATMASRRLIKYDTRPLILWSDTTPAASPKARAVSRQSQIRNSQPNSFPPQQPIHRFPVERLGRPQEAPRPNSAQSIVPDPVMEDSMDWTPSQPQEIRPRFVTTVQSAIQQPEESARAPFYGSIPQAPRPPAWQLRSPVTQRPPQTVPKTNPFHRSAAELQNAESNNGAGVGSQRPDVHFAPPKFFPPSDYTAMTGLENLFDQTFTIRSPEDDANENAVLQSNLRTIRSKHSQWSFLYTSIRLVFLSICLTMWMIDQLELARIPRDSLLICALIINILFTGFGLLASLNKPTFHIRRVLYSLIKFMGALSLAVCLSYNFSDRRFYHGGSLELCVKVLSALLAVEESLGLLSIYHRVRSRDHSAQSQTSASTQSLNRDTDSEGSASLTNQLSSQPSPPLESSFTPLSSPRFQTSSQGYGLYRKDMLFNPLRDDGSDASEASAADSDAETTATSYTNTSIRYMNPFSDRSEDFAPPRTPGLGSGLQGLSLDDTPQRMTRSRAARAMGMTTGIDSNPKYQARRIR